MKPLLSLIGPLAIIIFLTLGHAAAQPPSPPEPDATEVEQPKKDEKVSGKTDKSDKKAKAADLGGVCMGIATRCGLLPKGACFMQSGCFNPAFGDRCNGTARTCTQFNTRSSCYAQQGCTWIKPKS
jgi:hypothetical protein